MKKIDVRYHPDAQSSVLVGTLADRDNQIYFEYNKHFIERGLELSPYKLPLQAGLIEHLDRQFGPIFGLFDDSLPDGWGLLLMDRGLRDNGIDPATVSVLDRLAMVGNTAIGALTYHPAKENKLSDERFDLAAVCKNAQEIIEGSEVQVLESLILTGGSPGGARPKVMVGVAKDRIVAGAEKLKKPFEYWLIKFASKSEKMNAGPIEAAYNSMATTAHIDIPPFRLFDAGEGQRAFGCRRFDRDHGGIRYHLHTFGNMIHSNFRIPSADYELFLKVTLALTKDHTQVIEAFRRMVFNVISHNRDDHVKNFSFIFDAQSGWKLSPAYDLTFSEGPGGWHSMTLLGEGKSPNRGHIDQLAKIFGIAPKVVTEICDQVNAACRSWRKTAADMGCTDDVIKRIENKFVWL